MKYFKVKKNTDIQRIFKKGKRVFSRPLTLIYCPSDNVKMAVIVSKKHGKAVKRNRIKRLLRQAFYNTFSSIPFACEFILLPKTAQKYTLAEFENGLKSCYKKISL